MRLSRISERCVELGSEGSNLRWQQAQALLRLGRESEAFAVLDGYLEKNPKDEWDLAAQGRGAVLARAGGRSDRHSRPSDRGGSGQAVPLPRSRHILDVPGRRLRSRRSRSRQVPGAGCRWGGYMDQSGLRSTPSYLYDSCTKLYDPASALELARKAVAVDSGEDWYHGNLGGAAYRNGSYDEARDALLMAVELSYTEDAVRRFFFLAMTLEKLGDRDGARRWYDRAVARMDETYPENPELIAFKQEAAELLGIQPKSPVLGRAEG